MNQTVACPSCASKLTVPQTAGGEYRCPRCGKVVAVAPQATVPSQAFGTSETISPEELGLLREGAPAVRPSASDSSSFPGYEIIELLGKGGMGQVYKARQVSLNRLVALKVILADWLEHRDSVRRFQREAQAAGRLSHPNIVTIHDAAEVDGRHFLVMEFVPGTDLGALVRQAGPLAPQRACDYIRQAALGLEHARERGLVHRDIKPGNLLLTATGQVKVLDLGLARLMPWGDERRMTRLTEAGVILGTPAYLAPEQATDARRVDTRADVYSLGCTLYYLLTGRAPFAGASLADVVLQHQLNAPAPLATFRGDLPAGVQEVVTKMLAKRPAERYQTPGEVAQALAPCAAGKAAASTQVLPGHPTPARQRPVETAAVANLPPLIRRREQPRRWSAGMVFGTGTAIAGLVLVAVTAAWLATGAGKDKEQKQPATTPEPLAKLEQVEAKLPTTLPPAKVSEVKPAIELLPEPKPSVAVPPEPELPVPPKPPEQPVIPVIQLPKKEPPPVVAKAPAEQPKVKKQSPMKKAAKARVPPLEVSAKLGLGNPVAASYLVRLKAGRQYVIELTSVFEPSLLVKLDGEVVGKPNSRSSRSNSVNGVATQTYVHSLQFMPPQDGDYQIAITSVGGVGAYILKVR